MKRQIRKAFCTILVFLLLAAVPSTVAAETALMVGDEKVSTDEILYLLGLELGGSDALAAAAQATISLQMILAREIEANDRAVLSVCQIHGGNAFNVVPQEVEIAGTVRCFSPEVRSKIRERLESICTHIAASYRCEAVCDYTFGIPPVVNDPEETELLAEAARDILGSEKVIRLANPMMGSEDFAYFLQKVPRGTIFRLGVAGDTPVSLHNPGFNFPDEALPVGVAVFVRYVLEKLAR